MSATRSRGLLPDSQHCHSMQCNSRSHPTTWAAKKPKTSTAAANHAHQATGQKCRACFAYDLSQQHWPSMVMHLPRIPSTRPCRKTTLHLWDGVCGLGSTSVRTRMDLELSTTDSRCSVVSALLIDALCKIVWLCCSEFMLHMLRLWACKCRWPCIGPSLTCACYLIVVFISPAVCISSSMAMGSVWVCLVA